MLRTAVITTFVLFVAAFAEASEFWLQPMKFVYKVGDTIEAQSVWGKNFIDERLPLRNDQVVKLEHYVAGRMEDMKPLLKQEASRQVSFVAKDPGTHLLVMQSAGIVRTLAADTFNTYLKDSGLDEALFAREKNGSLNKPGKESYTLCTKLYLSAGAEPTGSCKKIAGLPLEIIPGKNPSLLKPGETLHCKIVWQGKPLFGARVKVWSRKDNRTLLQNIYTEKNGTIATPISSEGAWMVSVMHTSPGKTPQADWQTYWSSMVFGVE